MVKKPRILIIIGIAFLALALIFSIAFPPIIENRISTEINDFNIASIELEDKPGTPLNSPTGDIPLLMGNLTFLSLLWDKLLDGNMFPWTGYKYLPTIEMLNLLRNDIAIDSNGIYLPVTGQTLPLITGDYIDGILSSDKLYGNQGFDVNNLKKTSYTVVDLFTNTPLTVSYMGESKIRDASTYIYRGYRNNTGQNVREVLETLNISPDLFIDNQNITLDDGPTELLPKRFSDLINTTQVTEQETITYHMGQHLGVPLNILFDYTIFLDFPLLSEIMLKQGKIKTTLDGEITINPLFTSLVQSPGKIQQIVQFNITQPSDAPNTALIQEYTYFLNATTGQKLPPSFQFTESPRFAVNKKNLAYTTYPGTSNRTGIFLPPYEEPTAASFPLWDEVANTSGNAIYRGPIIYHNDTFIQYVLYQDNINFTNIPIFRNISNLLNLDIIYEGTTTYLLNQTTGFVYDIIFQGEFKLYIPLTLFPFEVTLGNLYLSFNSTFQNFMKQASQVIHDFKPIENDTLYAGTLHLEFTPPLTHFFTNLRGETLNWIKLLGFWLPIILGILGLGITFIAFYLQRKKHYSL